MRKRRVAGDVEGLWVNQPVIKENKIGILAIAAWALMLVAAGNGWIDPNTRAISIVAYGAKCDGVTDDTTAINNAEAALVALNPNGGGKLIFPAVANSAGCLVTGNGLNFTNTNGIHIEGQSAGEPTSNGPNAATIIGETTTHPIIDATGANDFTIDNLTIRAGGSNAPCIGILEARSTAVGGTFAQHHNFTNLWIYLGSNATCFAGLGNVGIYNYGSELGSMHNVNIDADNPWYVTPTNGVVAASSAFATIATGSKSMTGWDISGSSFSGEIGPPITAGDGSGASQFTGTVGSIKLNYDYFIHGGFHALVSSYAIQANVGLDDWEIFGNTEGGITRAIQFMSGISNHLWIWLQDNGATNSDKIFELTSNATGKGSSPEIENSLLSATITQNGATPALVDDSGGSNTAGVQNSSIWLEHGMTLSLHGSSAGDRIFSPDINPTVTVGTGAELHFAGNVFTNQLGTVTGNPAAEIGPSVATGNLYSITVSGGTLSTNKIIRCIFDGTYFNNSGSPDTPAFEVLYNGSGSQCGGGLSVAAANFNRPFHIVADISASAATNKQAIVGTCNLGSTNPATTSDALNITSINNTSIDSTANQSLVLFVSQGNNAAINSQLYYGACTLVN